MKTIIIEDEPLNVEHLQNMLKRIDSDIEIIATYDSIKSSIQGISKVNKCDLLFVDIHLADGLSFEIFTELNLDIPVIFTTAFDEYAIRAFKLNSIDYLLKPIDIKELTAAIEKFRKQNQTQNNLFRENITNIYSQLNKSHKSRFMVKLGDTIQSIKTDEISCFVFEDKFVVINTSEGKRYTIDYTLEQLESLVNPELFFRINRKVIININSIKKVNTYFNSRLILSTNTIENAEAIVSRERVNDFKAWLDR